MKYVYTSPLTISETSSTDVSGGGNYADEMTYYTFVYVQAIFTINGHRCGDGLWSQYWDG